jgi:hypothetical protein
MIKSNNIIDFKVCIAYNMVEPREEMDNDGYEHDDSK